MSSRSLLATITLVLLALLIWQLRWVILVFFGAIVIAVALDVLIQQIQSKLYLSRNISLLIVVLTLLVFGILLFQLLVPELISQVKELNNLLPKLIAKLNSIISNQPILKELQQSISNQFSWERTQSFLTQIIGFAGGAANSLFQFLLIGLLSILLVLDPRSHKQIIISVSPRPLRREINQLLDDCRVALGGWLSGMTISAITIFALTWAGLSVLKSPLALLSALVSGLLTFIPIIGPTTATLLPLGVSLIISPTLMFEVLILRLILQNLEAFLLTPLLLSRTVNLLPSVALIAQLSLGVLLGLPGVLIALPLTVVMQVCIQKIIVKRIMDKWN